MAQMPKGRLVMGPYFAICKECTLFNYCNIGDEKTENITYIFLDAES